MSASIDYQKYLSKKLESAQNSSDSYLSFNIAQNNFAINMNLLRNLIPWQTPHLIYPMPQRILGFILIGQIPTTIIALEKLDNLILQDKDIYAGIKYNFIVTINMNIAIGIALKECQIITIENLSQSIIINQEWIKNNILNIL